MDDDGLTTDAQMLGADRRSSSLSDLMDTAETDVFEGIDASRSEDHEGNETEAETERVEDSPFHVRKQQNVLLAPEGIQISTMVDGLADNSLRTKLHLRPEASPVARSSDDEMRYDRHLSPSNKKRKQASVDEASETDGSLSNSPQEERSIISHIGSPKSPSNYHANSLEEAHSHALDLSESDVASNKSRIGGKKPSKSRSKARSDAEENSTLGHGSVSDQQFVVPGLQNSEHTIIANVEDLEEDLSGEVDNDNANKSHEDFTKKKAALDCLSALEVCFATLRDKLFDERLAAANEELAMLQSPNAVHPELLSMKEAIDRQRQQKLKHQKLYLRYKLETLQRESLAVKHQIHSQYIQTVREIRDKSLDQLNTEFYQVQRERRKGVSDAQGPIYLYSKDRAQEVMRQTAYNSEVSILSGFARFRGFPAAPAVKKARPSECEEDMRSMGIPSQIAPRLPSNVPVTTATLPLSGTQNRQTNSAEENFIERNAWANPQHPAHQQRLQQQRQAPPITHAAPPQTPSAYLSGKEPSTKSNSSAPSLNELSAPAFAMSGNPGTMLHSSRSARTSVPGDFMNKVPMGTVQGEYALPEPEQPSEIDVSNQSSMQTHQSLQAPAGAYPQLRQVKHDNPQSAELPRPLPFAQNAESHFSAPG